MIGLLCWFHSLFHPVDREIRKALSGKEYAFLDYEHKLYERACRPQLIPSGLAGFFVVALILCDAACLKSQWNSLIKEDFMMVWLITFAASAVLDIPLALLGSLISPYLAGRKNVRLAVIIKLAVGLGAFAVIFVCYAKLRAATSGLTFLRFFGDGARENPAVVSPEKIASAGSSFLTFMPLCTSALSFLIGLSTSRPVAEKKAAIEYFNRRAEAFRVHLSQALTELGDAEAFREKLLGEETRTYEAFQATIRAWTGKTTQTAYLELAKHCHDPEKLNRISSDAALTRQEGAYAVLQRQDPYGGEAREKKPDGGASSASGGGFGPSLISGTSRVAAFAPEPDPGTHP